MLSICERCGSRTETHWKVPVRRDSNLIVYALVCEDCYNAVLRLAHQDRDIQFGFLEELGVITPDPPFPN